MSGIASMPGKVDKEQLEDWLAQTLVPVAPSAQFVHRLRGRIVTYQRGGLPSAWMLLVVGGVLFALVAASLSLAFRVLLALLSLLGLVERQRQQKKRLIQSGTD